MSESLLSVGIDLGTTTTQVIVSKLEIRNTASAFSVPHLEIGARTILYQSEPVFTPLSSETVLDAEAIKQIVRQEYQKAGIEPSQVQTGAVIITGETARKENAEEVLRVLSDLAGKFVVATAGPALESMLAAKGAGADDYAKRHGTPVLHMDIGGGTTNLALFDAEGKLQETGCVNVGGRLIQLNSNRIVTYVSPVLNNLTDLHAGMQVTKEMLQNLAEMLAELLEQTAGLRPKTKLLQTMVTDRLIENLPEKPIISFSGGVSDLIEGEETDWLRYGDLGVLLGRAIRQSRLCSGAYILGRETVRATVIGAGCYSTELSGSTVEYDGCAFPMENIPAVAVSDTDLLNGVLEPMKQTMGMHETPFLALTLKGEQSPSYETLNRYADRLVQLTRGRTDPVIVVLLHDMAKSLGQALRGKLEQERTVICLDGISMPEGSYLDILAPVGRGSAVPVVVKTLAFER